MTQPNEPQTQKPWEQNYPAGLNWNEEVPVGTMLDTFEKAIEKYGDRTCLNFMGKKHTYNEVAHMVDRFAKGLQDQGIGKGSNIGLCLPNSSFYPIAYYGALKAGATVVNFNPLYPEEKMAHQVNDSECDMMVTLNAKKIQPKVDNLLESTCLKKVIVCDIADAMPWWKSLAFKFLNAAKGLFGKPVDVLKVKSDDTHISFAKMLKSKGEMAPVDIQPGDVALKQYTGGTTGDPKAAMLTHGNLFANIWQTRNWFNAAATEAQDDKQQKMMILLPLYHVFSMTVQMNQSIELGAEIFMPFVTKFDEEQLAKDITKEKPTMFGGVPELYQKLVGLKNLGDYDLSSVDLWMSGGSAMPVSLADEWRKVTGKDLTEGYGLSETSPLACANPLDGNKKVGSIGFPVQGTSIRFAKIDDPEQECEPGEEGEICIKGPQVMQGYSNLPEETAKVMTSDGYFRTGDIGVIDEDGFIWITDRLKDMIITSGLNVYPKKIEEAIRSHESVSQVSVIGVPDEDSGEVAKAFIVYKEGEEAVADAEMKAFLRGKLAAYEVPRYYEQRDELPLTATGVPKPDKKALRAQEAAAREAAEQGVSAPQAPSAGQGSPATGP